MPRRPRHVSHRGQRPPRTARGAVDLDPAARLRALVAEGIVVAAALKARDDLELAAASMRRLGALTSGMWRALSRELDTAAERLDRSIDERLDDIGRRASALGVEEEDVVDTGFAAAHLESHRETLEGLLPADEDMRALLGPNMLFGFSVDDAFPGLDDDEDEAEEDHADEEDEKDEEDGTDTDDEAEAPWSVRVSLFLWAAPLTPVEVAFVPTLLTDTTETDAAPLSLSLLAPASVLDALSKATQRSVEHLQPALLALGVACWSAHQTDDAAALADDDDEDEDENEEDDGDAVSDEEDQSLGSDDR